ncbi:UDP-Gal or UDP-GlcNAc-dependent glycosyltransferase [Trypanosoma theileri]|uniref:Hexosyltransferase n=1 Tax=Trypanosoma theileri TaxID=67003 RepID=A0A1X0NJ86_9TRYP|nr:UDP-Gal or UDP-GlcNAc-dependent glycosyltransferase [Trypanosoma theileri]ORC84746.1 UDP-Gal or UDP-GlcNAc-dependent glycosyltransferase [Trypanosoma theileri]
MANRSSLHLSRAFLCCIVVLIATLVLFYFDVDGVFSLMDLSAEVRPVGFATSAPRSVSLRIHDESLRYIPHNSVRTWMKRDYLIVLGIPSEDITPRQRRRYLQRTTCWQFPGVATRSNNFTGSMLVLYVLARHPSQGYNYSTALEKEGDEYHDVITLPMNEGRYATNKTISGDGFWGSEAEIGMSRKTYFWFEFALRFFPHVNYIAKSDDDMFLRVPQYLVDLRTLPRRGLYWGPLGKWRVGNHFYFIVGFFMTLARDVVEKVVSNEELQHVVRLPYSKERESEFLSLDMGHEDVMVGRALYKSQYPHLLFATEKKCRFHNVRCGSHKRHISKSSVVVHHITEEEYTILMNRFWNDTTPSPKSYKRKKKSLEMNC